MMHDPKVCELEVGEIVVTFRLIVSFELRFQLCELLVCMFQFFSSSSSLLDDLLEIDESSSLFDFFRLGHVFAPCPVFPHTKHSLSLKNFLSLFDCVAGFCLSFVLS